MDICPICWEELEAFANFSDRLELNENFLAYLRDMWNSGYVRPEWCFVAKEAGKFIGRISYWSLPSIDKPFICDFLEVPWSGNYLEIGTELIQKSLTHLDLDTVEYQLNIPLEYSAIPEKRIELLKSVGFSLVRETIRFEWQDTQAQILPSTRLIFRSLDEVSEDAFVNAIALASSQTLDRSILEDQSRLGLQQEAVERFNKMKALKYKLAWWQLAYTPNGSLVGLIMPAENDGGATIAFIGVLPEHRGQGYGNDLLQQGTLTHKNNDARRIRTDVDINNQPSIRTFQRAGYKQFASRQEYVYVK